MTENKRLLTPEEIKAHIAKNCQAPMTKDELIMFNYGAFVQDAKTREMTLKEVGEKLENEYEIIGSRKKGKVEFRMPIKDLEALKLGKLPEK